MLRSLRFRLPAIFLLGMLVAALVTAAVAVRFFQDDTRSRTLAELRAPGRGARRAVHPPGDVEHRRGQPGAALRSAAPRGGDGLPALLRRRRDLPGPGLRPRLAPARPARRGGAGRGPGADVRVRAAGDGAHLPRGRLSGQVRRRDVRGDHRRQAARGAPGAVDRPDDAPRARVARRARDRARPRLVPDAARDEAGARPLARRGRGRRPPLLDGAARADGERRDRAPHRAVPGDDRAPRRGGGARAQLPRPRVPRAAHADHRDPRARRRAPARASPTIPRPRRRRSTSSAPPPTGSRASSATSSTSPGSRRTASRSRRRRSSCSGSSSRASSRSRRKPGAGRSATTWRSTAIRSSTPTATACSRSSRTC